MIFCKEANDKFSDDHGRVILKAKLSKQQGFKKHHILRRDHNSESKPTTKT